jgi:16S rRNA (adenine1518-N6/adenine1519-N6)-dimethyltransferase
MADTLSADTPSPRLRPLRSLGQHFLVDRGIVRRIVAAAGVGPDDTVLEIGPGRGILTEGLLQAGARVVAVEMDRGLHRALAERFRDAPRLTLHHGDALRFDLGPMPAAYKVVANLPYQVTTPLLFHLLEARPAPAVAVLMVQREVADRLLAAPGTKAYGVLTLGVRARARCEACLAVPPGAFRPPPRVRSTVVRITPLTSPLVPEAEMAGFMAVVRAALGRRRKTLRNALATLDLPPERVAAALAAAGIDPGARGETLDPAAFLRLHRALAV